jgi:hypothetical protein
VAVAFAVSVAVSMWLERWADARGRAWGAERGIYSRADWIPPAVIRLPQTEIGNGLADLGCPAIESAPTLIVNIFGRLNAEQAEIIRQALPAGATTEGKNHP